MQRSARTAALVAYAALPAPSGDLDVPSVSNDELELFVVSKQNGDLDISTSRRTDRSVVFPPVTRNAELSSGAIDSDPEISFDGTTIWLASNRNGNMDIYVATRACMMP
jgi:Tol biopolymer transport system component